MSYNAAKTRYQFRGLWFAVQNDSEGKDFIYITEEDKLVAEKLGVRLPLGRVYI
jgi:hypothetical protein